MLQGQPINQPINQSTTHHTVDLQHTPYVLYGLNILTQYPLLQSQSTNQPHIIPSRRLDSSKWPATTITLRDVFCAEALKALGAKHVSIQVLSYY